MYEKYSGLPDTAKSSTPARHGSTGNTGRYSRADADEYYAQPQRPQGGSSGNRSRSSARKKKQRRRKLIVYGGSLLLLALFITAIVVLTKGCSSPGATAPVVDESANTFRMGVYINGADVAGKTIDEVRGTLQSNEDYAINNISITLQGDGFSKVISGSDMAVQSNLDEVLTTALSGGANQVYYTAYTLDVNALAARIDEINATLASPPTDASFTVEIKSSGKPEFTYVEGQAGFGIDVESTAKLVQDAFDKGQYQTTLEPAITRIEPSVTVADVKAHTTLIGSCTTTYDFKGTAEDTEEQRLELIPNRASNLEKAAGLINNQVVKPGRTWSFNDTVGNRNDVNAGWKEANGIFGGDRFSRQLGGGVCQVSTTLYNALLECYPYVDFSRRKHSIPSTYAEKGLDATVDSGHIDFKFTNKSEYPLYVFAYISKNSKSSSRKRDVTVLIYGEALPEGVTYRQRAEVIQEIFPGEAEITETKKLYIGEEQITAEARSGFVVDVYVDRYLNSDLQESIFLYTDTYNGNPEKKRVGTNPTPTPAASETPAAAVTPTPNPQDQP